LYFCSLNSLLWSTRNCWWHSRNEAISSPRKSCFS